MKIMNFKIFELHAKRFKYEIIETEPLENLEKYKDHRRLKVFYHKGVECVECGLTGSVIGHGIDKGGNVHKDIYHINDKGEYIPLNIDHIIPKSRGGSNSLKNLQPMCYDCNIDKGGSVTQDDIKKGSFTKKRKKKKGEKSTDISIGDIVYNKKTDKELGKVIDIKPNPKHPREALAAVIEDKDPNSLYTLNRLYTIV